MAEYQRLQKQHDDLRFQYSCIHASDVAGHQDLRLSLMRHVQEVLAFMKAVRDVLLTPLPSESN
jgi:hypothetical protein